MPRFCGIRLAGEREIQPFRLGARAPNSAPQLNLCFPAKAGPTFDRALVEALRALGQTYNFRIKPAAAAMAHAFVEPHLSGNGKSSHAALLWDPACRGTGNPAMPVWSKRF